MCAFEAGGKPAVSLRAIYARSAALAAMLALTGCASTNNPYAEANAPTARVAQVAEMEDDGLPAQTPPSARIRQIPDDPSEPFSRNYGGFNPSRTPLAAPEEPQPARAPQPAIPSDLPPAFRKQLAAAIMPDE